MEEACEESAKLLLVNSNEKNILCPIESSAQLNERLDSLVNLKKSYSNPHLIIGLINEDPAVSNESLNQELENLASIDCVDQVIILNSKPSADYFHQNKFDLLAAFNPSDYRDIDQVVYLNNYDKPDLDQEVVVESEVNDLNNDSKKGVKRTSRIQTITADCKKRLKSLKTSLWRSPFSTTTFENALNRSRFYLQKTFQDWNERRERVLRSWINRAGATTSLLVKMLREVWENA